MGRGELFGKDLDGASRQILTRVPYLGIYPPHAADRCLLCERIRRTLPKGRRPVAEETQRSRTPKKTRKGIEKVREPPPASGIFSCTGKCTFLGPGARENFCPKLGCTSFSRTFNSQNSISIHPTTSAYPPIYDLDQSWYIGPRGPLEAPEGPNVRPGARPGSPTSETGTRGPAWSSAF